MAASASYEIVILFEDEIRLAAKALADLECAEDASDEDYERAGSNALKACFAALSGAHKPGVVLVLGRKPAADTAPPQKG
jgi:hypothetical protein